MAARRAVIIIDAETKEGQKNIAALEGQIEGVTAQTIEAEDALERWSGQVDNVSGATNTTADAVGNLAQKNEDLSRTANFAAVNLGRIAQDAPYGLIGIANNIEPAVVSLQRLNQQAQQAGTSLLPALSKALMGPTGVAVAVISFIAILESQLPRIRRFFRESREGAEELRKATQEALEQVADFQVNVAGVQFSPADLPEAERMVEEEIATRETRLQATNDQINDIRQQLVETGRQLGSNTEQLDAQGDLSKEQREELVEQRKELSRQFRTLIDQRKTIEDQIDGFEEAKTQVEDAREAYQDQVDAQRILLGIGGRLKDEGEDIADNEEDAADEAERRLNALEQIDAIQAARNRRFLQGGSRPDFAAETQAGIQMANVLGAIRGGAAPSPLQQVQQQLQRESAFGLFANDAERAQREVGLLNQALTELAQDPDIDPEAMGVQDLIAALQEARDEAEEYEGQVDETDQAHQRLAASVGAAGSQMVNAFRQSKLEAEDLLNILTSLAGSALSIFGGGPAAQFGGRFLSGLRFAHGTDAGFPGIGMVGERGRELAVAPPYSSIITNENTERLERALTQIGTGGSSDRITRAIEQQTRRLEAVERKAVVMEEAVYDAVRRVEAREKATT